MELSLDPNSLSYEAIDQVTANPEKITTEINQDTAYFLDRQSQYQSYGMIRERNYLNSTGEIESVLSLDVVLDRAVAVEDIAALANFQVINDGDISIAIEVSKGFQVVSIPLANLGSPGLVNLNQELKLQQIHDFSLGDQTKLLQYQQQLEANYPDLVEFESNAPGSERLYLPQLGESGLAKVTTAISPQLLEAIQSKNTDLNFNRLDLIWLKSNLELPDNLTPRRLLLRVLQGII